MQRHRLPLLLLAALAVARNQAQAFPRGQLPGNRACAGTSSPLLFGLLSRPITLDEMVVELERGCLALDGIRFRPGQDTIEMLSPAHFAEVARALGRAGGTYRISVPPEGLPGMPINVVQARRRAIRLRDELMHYGASSLRLLEPEDSETLPPPVPPGTAIPMLVRVTPQG